MELARKVAVRCPLSARAVVSNSVLTEPPADWAGETGFVRTDLLARHLPSGYGRFQFFICGPAPMMDAAETALTELGVPDARIHTERFDMV